MRDSHIVRDKEKTEEQGVREIQPGRHVWYKKPGHRPEEHSCAAVHNACVYHCLFKETSYISVFDSFKNHFFVSVFHVDDRCYAVWLRWTAQVRYSQSYARVQ